MNDTFNRSVGDRGGSVIRARTIGAMEIEIQGRRLPARSGLTFALATYLCVRAGERISRDHLRELLWPDSDEERGRHSLRQLLYRLRTAGFNPSEDGDDVYLETTAVDCDAHAILDARWPDGDTWGLEGTNAQFLPRLTRDLSEPFRLWVDSTRARIGTQIARRAVKQIERARQEGRWSDIHYWAEVVLNADPLNEEATLAKAESFAMLGAKATALELLDQYLSDLGPRTSQLALPTSVLRRRISERRADWTLRRPGESSLVGRESLMSRLTQLLSDAAGGDGRSALLIGPAGVGKSRLAAETRAVAELRGFRTVDIFSSATTSSRPFGLAVALAHALRELPGAAGSAPQALATARRLTQSDHEPANGLFSAGDLSVGHLQWTLVELLGAVSSESRLLLTVEDIHHVDPGSISLLTSLAGAARGMRVAMILTSRPDSAIAASSGELAPGIIRIIVPPLSDEAAAALSESVATSLTLRTSLEGTKAIVRAAGGNPLFLRELTATNGARHTPGSLPQSLSSLIETRLSQLSQLQLRLLRIATLLGPHVTLRRIRALFHTDSTGSPLDTTLEQLESHGIITGSATGTLVVHECWMTCISAGMSLAVKGALSLECAEALLQHREDSDAAELMWRAAELFVASGSASDARRCLNTAGEVLLTRGLARQAVAAFLRALTLSQDDSVRAQQLVVLARAQSLTGDHVAATASASEAVALCAVLRPAQPTVRVQALATLVDSLWRHEAPHESSLAELATAVTLPHVTNPDRHYACLVGIRVVYNAAASPLGVHFDRIIAESSASFGPTLPGELGRLVHASETATEPTIRERCAAVAALTTDDQPTHLRARSLRYRASALRFIGDTCEAGTLGRSAYEMSLRAGEPDEAHTSALFLAYMALDWGDLGTAREWIDASRELLTGIPPTFQHRESLHARARLSLQEGRFGECYSLYEPAMDTARNDTMLRRQVVDCACIALAASHLKHDDVAEEMLGYVRRALAEDRPGSQLDFVAEILLRTLRRQMKEAELRSVADEYLARRNVHFRRPMPAGFVELRRVIGSA